MLYIVLHGSELVGVMTSPVDAALIAKPLQAQVWSCQPNNTKNIKCSRLSKRATHFELAAKYTVSKKQSLCTHPRARKPCLLALVPSQLCTAKSAGHWLGIRPKLPRWIHNL